MADEAGGIETGAGTATQEGAEGAGGGAAAGGADAPPEWAQRLSQGFDQFTSRLGALEERLPQPAEEEPPADEPLDLDAIAREFDDAAFDQDTGALTAQGQAQLVQELVRREIQAARDKDFAEREDQRRDSEADALEQKYPALTKDEVLNPVLDRVHELARTLGQPALAQEPRVVEIVYLAMAGEKAAAAERGAGEQQDVHLERSGSAGPAEQPSDQAAVGDSIVQAIRGRQFRTSR